MTELALIAARVFNTPLMILPEKAEAIAVVLSERAGIDAADLKPGALVDNDEKSGGSSMYETAPGGVAVIRVAGTMVNRGAWVGANSGLVSYEGIRKQISAAQNDVKVKSVVFDMDTPGGEASGCFELAETIRAIGKPTTAVVNGLGCSAGYAIASACNRVVVSPSATIGSIGVVMMHLDRSGEMAKKGIKPTFIFAGKHKVDGNQAEPLTDGVRRDLQASIDVYYEMFLDTVAAGRGSRLSKDAARHTEARVFIGDQAVKAGLADAVGSLSSVLSNLSPAANRTKPRGAVMATDTEENGVVAVAQIDTKTIEAEAFAKGKAEGLTEGAKQGADAASARIFAILDAPEAKGREAQARALAAQPTISTETAIAVLKAAPAASEIANASAAAGFAARMEANESNTVSAEASSAGKDPWKKVVARVNERQG